MKVLTPFLVLLVLCNTLSAKETIQNNNLDKYISKYKKKQFNYDYEKNELEASKLRDSWIAPLNLQYKYSKDNSFNVEQERQTASLQINQTIFQSGGIYYGIKYAEASRKYGNFSVDVAKRKLVKDAISLLMQIKQMDMKIQRQNLQIKNSEISLSQKREQYLNGQLDSGFLDNAVIERNFVIETLYDLQTNKQRLISNFHAISDIDYKDAYIPKLKELRKEDFLQNNIVIRFTRSDIEKTAYFQNVTITKYLPKVTLLAGYNWQAKSFFRGNFLVPETDYFSYGIGVSMPLDINTFKDIQSARVDNLKSQVRLEDKKRELSALYEQVMQNIENFNKKKLLSLENKKIYTRLLNETRELFKAGYKTEYDVGLLENSVIISGLDYQILEIDKQLELLTLYEMYKQ